MNPMSEMRWWHGGIFLVLGGLWRMLKGHIQRVDAHFKLNGYSVDVKKGKDES